MNRRLTMLLADGLVAAATIILVVLFWSGQVDIWHVFLILFLRALGGAFHWPAMQSSMTLMVPPEFLTRIQWQNQTLHCSLNIVAAPLGALLLSMLPMQSVLAIDVITAVIAMIPLLFIHVPQPDAPARAAGPRWMLIYSRQIGTYEHATKSTVENHLFREDGSKGATVGVTNRANPTFAVIGTTNVHGHHRINGK